MMLNGRRVGTFSAGIMLVILGLLFLARLVFPELNYTFIVSLWPFVLIFLGIEIIISFIVNKDEKLKYDGAAILLVIILTFFAMCMAGAEFAVNHLTELRNVNIVY